jgi:cytochrome c-type biogenesis protein CcmH
VRRWLGWIAIGWLLLLCGLALIAYGNPAPRTSLSDRTMAVAKNLRCLVCQGESVADSPSGFSQGIRAEIRRRLQAGQSPDQIERFLVSKYGDKILLAPPQSGIGDLAWLAPPVLVLAGAVLLVMLVLDWRQRGRTPSEAVRDEYLERVRAELAAGASSAGAGEQ